MTVNNRPKCQVPGCGKYAQNTNTTAKPRWRRASWVVEKFGVTDGYVCSKHHFKKYDMGDWQYKKYRKKYCENIDGRLGFKCTTTIVDSEWQLDCDHIDGNPFNNNLENIQTLCKCCHAIKTRDSRDYATEGRTTLKKKFKLVA